LVDVSTVTFGNFLFKSDSVFAQEGLRAAEETKTANLEPQSQTCLT